MCTDVPGALKDLETLFNAKWASNSSREFAEEVLNCAISLVDSVSNVFTSLGDTISKNVSNFNTVEKEELVFDGFKAQKPTLSITINETLPNGKKGVLDGADLNTLVGPIDKLYTNATADLDEIVKYVCNSDAFDIDEQTALSNTITGIKTKFVQAISELKTSMKTRVSNEIATRSTLDTTNVQNLSI